MSSKKHETCANIEAQGCVIMVNFHFLVHTSLVNFASISSAVGIE